MNILKPGKRYHGTCPECGCEFEAAPKEIKMYSDFGLPAKMTTVAKCPGCGTATDMTVVAKGNLLNMIREAAEETVKQRLPSRDETKQCSDPDKPQLSCPTCGSFTVNIRGRYPGSDRRIVCPACLADRLAGILKIASADYGIVKQEKQKSPPGIFRDPKNDPPKPINP